MTRQTTPRRKKSTITPAVPTEQVDYSKRAISASFTIPIYVQQAFLAKYPKGEVSKAVTRLMKADLGIA